MSENWIERWREGRIGWHQPEGNKSLQKHWHHRGGRVLVPLCGKSVDLRWLAEQGNEVVGVELSRLAVEAFFVEQELRYTIQGGDPSRYEATDIDITIFCCDYFELRSIRCDGHYDRGALIAMPRAQRPHYAAHTNSLLQAEATQLIVTLEYDESVAQGPPFSVTADELCSYWPQLDCVDEHDDIANAPPKFAAAGLVSMVEKVWRTPGAS